jgi:hypothetical protein
LHGAVHVLNDELLIDLEEDKAARAVVFGLLAEMERSIKGRTSAACGAAAHGAFSADW